AAGDVAEPQLIAVGQRLFHGFDMGGRASLPCGLPDADAVLQPARATAADVVSNQIAWEGIERRAAHRSQRRAPFPPAGGRVARALENGGVHAGRDVSVT